MSRRPAGQDLYSQMMQQRLQGLQNQQQADFQAERQRQQSQLAADQQSFSAQLEQRRLLAAAQVAGQQAGIDQGIRAKTQQPVKLGTLLTSPSGLLGNPLLSITKLSG